MSPFPDNWAYLKAELAWLDRVLMGAVARHQDLHREIEQQARTPADKATSHWWQGFILLDYAKGGSQIQPNLRDLTHPLGRYGDRIEYSLKQNIPLSIPQLCQHLQLSKFERDVIILCLAPEISRRYEKIYALLNNDDTPRPTVDLALRLFCRSDQEWRTARRSFLSTAPLIKNKLLCLHPSAIPTLLAHSLSLPEKLVTYCLEDHLPLDRLLPRRRSRKPPSI
ncbi:MAG: hypothetical protein ACK4QL_02920 [Pseudanabaenaceae cyanobacterium]